MRLLLTALNCPKGDVAGNLARHLELVDAGRQRGCDLVVLPEMSLTGYSAATPLQVSDGVVAELVEATAAGPGLCFGFVESVRPEDRVRFITQVIAVDGRVAAVHRKAGLGEDEADLFAAGTAGGGFEVGRVACSVAVCAEIGTHPPYALGSPSC